MLVSPKSAKVLEKVYEVALSDGHPGQMAAMKLVLDRIVPVSTFDATKQAGGVSPDQYQHLFASRRWKLWMMS